MDDEAIAEAAGNFGPLAEKEPLSVLARVSGQPPASKLRVLHLWIMHEFKERRFGPFEQFLNELSIRRASYYSSSTRLEDPWLRTLRDTLRLTLQFALQHSQEWTADRWVKSNCELHLIDSRVIRGMNISVYEILSKSIDRKAGLCGSFKSKSDGSKLR